MTDREAAAASPPKNRPRRPAAQPRPHRRLRWAAILVGFAAAAVLTLVVTLSLLQDRLDRGMLLRIATARLEALLERPVAASGLDFSLLEGRFDLHDLQIGQARVDLELTGPAPPIMSLDRLQGRLGWRSLIPTGLHLEDLAISGVRVWGMDDGGSPAPATSPSAGWLTETLLARITLSSERMSFSGTTVGYRNRPTPWEVRLDDLELDFRAGDEGGVDGTLRSRVAAIRMWDRPDLVMAVEADLRLRGALLHLDEVTFTGDLLWMEGSGTLDLANDLAGPLTLTGGGRGGGVSRLMFDFHGLDTTGDPPFSFAGGAEFIEDGLAISGDLSVPAGRFYGIPIETWDGFLYIGPDRVEISSAKGVASGGEATLLLLQPQPREEHRAQIVVTAAGASLGAAASGLFGVPTTLESEFDLEADLEMVLGDPEGMTGTIRATGRVPGITPLDARRFGFVADLEMDDAQTTVRELVVEGEAFRATAEGRFPRGGTADLEVSALAGESAEGDALQQEIRRVLFGEDPAEIAWDVAGAAGFEGTVGGRWPDRLVLEGEVEGRSLSIGPIRTDTLIAIGGVGPEDMWLDSFNARRGESTLQASGVMDHGDEEYPDMDFDVSWERWDARELIDYLEWDLEADGIVSGHAETVREDEWYAGGGEVVGWDGHVLEQPFDEARAAWSLLGDRARLAPIEGSFGGGTAGGALDVGLIEWELEGRITGADFPLTPGLAPEWITLRSDFALEIGGDIEIPELALEARVPNAAVLGLELGPGAISASVLGEDFVGQGALDSGRASFDMTGKVPLGIEGEGSLRIGGIDIAPLAFEDAGERGIRMVASGTGDFFIADPLDEWMEGGGDLTSLDIEAPMLVSPVRLTGPASILVEDARVHVGGIELTDGANRLRAAGSVGLDDLLLDLRVDGAASLEAAASLVSGLRAEGTVELDTEVVGSALSPEVLGRGTLRDASFRVDGFPHELTGVNGIVNFDRRTLRISEVIGTMAGGEALVSGAVSFEEADFAGVDLRLGLADVRLRYPRDLTATIGADLQLVGDRSGRLLSGEVRLDEAVWSREYELFSSILSDLDVVSTPADEEAEGFLGNLMMDVRVLTDAPFAVRNSIFQLDAAADFGLRGSAAAPALLGRADLVGGEVYFGAHRFQVVEGRADFIDPEGIEPVFEIEAETNVRSYRVRLQASGTMDRIEANLTSEPPLREADVYRLLLGAPEEDLLTRAQDDDVAAASAASLLSQQLSNMIGRRAGRVFGIDRLTIDPFMIGRFSNPTARVTLAKQLSRDLNVRYSSSVTAAEESIIVVEYTPRGPVSWIFSRDQDGSLGVDVRFHRSF